MNNNTEQLIPTKAVIVSVNTGDDALFSYQLAELRNLCASLAIEVVEEICQNLTSIHPGTYVGSGKLQEIKQICESMMVDYVIFNDELSPAQLRNIDSLFDETEVKDRTMIILDIFAARSQTKEAFLQVEIARLRYMLPRLIGTRPYLSRIGGGGGGSAGARRGSGETKLELDRRHIERKINADKKELDEITKNRATARKLRLETETPIVAFVGYTNAGKSTTINTLLEQFNNSDKKVFAEDMLFATLETATRKIKLTNNQTFLVTDTVGFVSKLPHHLIQSFKSTLEEIKEASLLVHVIDASSEFAKMQVETTNQVLKELAVSDIPTIYVYNKIDLVKNRAFLMADFDYIPLSSKTTEGYDQLVQKITEMLFDQIVVCEMHIPFAETQVFSLLKEKAEIITTEYGYDGTKITVRLPKKLYNKYKQYVIE